MGNALRAARAAGEPSLPQRKLLQTLAAGCHVEARRLAPFPFRWYVVNSGTGSQGDELSEATVHRLVTAGRLAPERLREALPDVVVYRLTDSGLALGRVAAKGDGKATRGAE